MNKKGMGWENGNSASFNGKLHNEVTNRVVFDTVFKVKVLVKRGRRDYIYICPHRFLG